MRKLFTLTTVASGAAIGILVVGALAIVAGIYTRDVVHDQLAPQKIYFPEKGDELPPELNDMPANWSTRGPRPRPTPTTTSAPTWRASARARAIPRCRASS